MTSGLFGMVVCFVLSMRCGRITARLAGRRVSNTSVFILVPMVLLIVILAYSCRHQADFAVA